MNHRPVEDHLDLAEDALEVVTVGLGAHNCRGLHGGEGKGVALLAGVAGRIADARPKDHPVRPTSLQSLVLQNDLPPLPVRPEEDIGLDGHQVARVVGQGAVKFDLDGGLRRHPSLTRRGRVANGLGNRDSAEEKAFADDG